MDKLIKYILFSFMALALWQCSETKEVDPEISGYDYFPLQTGMYQVYQVKGTRYLSYEDSIPFSYLLKESVVDSFDNLEEGISYKILREKKSVETDDWETDSIWTARKDNLKAVRVENNIPHVALVFPLGENKKWDGNKLNNNDEDEFEMVQVRQSYNNGVEDFPETVTVIQEDLPDIYVQSIYKTEIYARGRGLVYKEINMINYRQGNDYGLQKAESGLRYFQSLIAYGAE